MIRKERSKDTDLLVVEESCRDSTDEVETRKVEMLQSLEVHRLEVV